jgi:NAD(P)-dependent dehydrogenase (short-subunit alcohol dehydrogenase family)
MISLQLNQWIVLSDPIYSRSFASVKAFAAALQKQPRLDVLICNAGIWASARPTVDGIGGTAQVREGEREREREREREIEREKIQSRTCEMDCRLKS